jgi:hypothetical protein
MVPASRRYFAVSIRLSFEGLLVRISHKCRVVFSKRRVSTFCRAKGGAKGLPDYVKEAGLHPLPITKAEKEGEQGKPSQ